MVLKLDPNTQGKASEWNTMLNVIIVLSKQHKKGWIIPRQKSYSPNYQASD